MNNESIPSSYVAAPYLWFIAYSLTLFCICSFQETRAAGVQRGTAASISNGTTPVTISAVDTTKAFLVFQTRHNSNRPVACQLRGRIASPTTLEFDRVTNEATPVRIDIQWYVVEYASGIKVQRGQTDLSGLTTNVGISAVASLSQAFVTWSKTPAPTDNTWDQSDPIIGELTTTSNLQFRTNNISGPPRVSWQVIEYTNPAIVNVQKGSLSTMGKSTLSVTATLPQPVNVNQTFVLVGYKVDGGTNTAAPKMLRAQLTDSVTITIDRCVTAAFDTVGEISWQAVELKDGSTVQQGSQHFDAGVAQQIVDISPVDISRSVAFASVQPAGGQNMGRTWLKADDTIGVGCVTMSLTSNQVTMTRNNSSDSADIGWFVVQFSPSLLPIQLAAFTATVASANTVHLAWSTVTETNNYGFYVQRLASTDQDFADLRNSFIAGHGTTLQPQQYSFTDASVTIGQWSYRLKQIDLDGTVHYTDAVSVDVLTDVKDQNKPTAFALEQNYPNPFNPETVISYSVPPMVGRDLVSTDGRDGQLPVVSGQSPVVSLKVFDILGREVAVLVKEVQAPGSYSVRFNANGLASGMYFYKLTAGTFSETKRLVLMK